MPSLWHWLSPDSVRSTKSQRYTTKICFVIEASIEIDHYCHHTNWPISQIPQYIRQIWQNVHVCNRNVRICMCTFMLQKFVGWYIRRVNFWICGMGLLDSRISPNPAWVRMVIHLWIYHKTTSMKSSEKYTLMFTDKRIFPDIATFWIV